MAYRLRYILRVRGYEALREVVKIYEELNALAGDLKLTQGKTWVRTFGPFEELVWEADFPDLATYEKETTTFFSDPRAHDLAQRLDAYLIEGSPGENQRWEEITSADLGA